jgi:hypothetical protein
MASGDTMDVPAEFPTHLPEPEAFDIRVNKAPANDNTPEEAETLVLPEEIPAVTLLSFTEACRRARA